MVAKPLLHLFIHPLRGFLILRPLRRFLILLVTRSATDPEDEHPKEECGEWRNVVVKVGQISTAAGGVDLLSHGFKCGSGALQFNGTRGGGGGTREVCQIHLVLTIGAVLASILEVSPWDLLAIGAM